MAKVKKISVSWLLLDPCSRQWGGGGQVPVVGKDTEVVPVLFSPQFSFLVMSQTSEKPGTHALVLLYCAFRDSAAMEEGAFLASAFC